ncbi:ribonuclease inhibitor [Dyadobacter chenhuakuii]|uniref:Ribonuclease inhibitor n=1 Tax=Dyadobacter chenhuakuii TaxID=2909339 RepID=A0ABY4XMR0_9BACT|nr:ribonuclease inhibitor [Dyadobacter chenhuakuii]MCF2494358.1 ribonuclease inhibitor [Dyadobacter chenhuakuii]USJ31479.1 ribonuclease inhibitor [Dyadobacter chenhuakuii]
MQLTIQGSSIQGIASFYTEINRLFMADEEWQIAESLDALDDLLYRGFGAAKGATALELIWLDMEISRLSLGYEETRRYYLEKLRPGSPFNKALFSEKLKALETSEGKTYFDLVMDVFASHPAVIVVPG